MAKRRKRKVVVVGGRWFQRSYGNTYHAVRVYVDGELVAVSGVTYGYGDHYLQTALSLLVKAGVYRKDEEDEHRVLWRVAEGRGDTLEYRAQDYDRQGDLKRFAHDQCGVTEATLWGGPGL